MSQSGGALALITPPFIKENFDNAQHLGIRLINCKFENNQANNMGGALYLENPYKAVIEGCLFRGNNASSKAVERNFKGYKPTANDEDGMSRSSFETGSGGAIYYVCEPSSTTSTLDCDLSITDTSFLSNTAQIKGGALHSYNVEPRIHQQTVKLASNTAGRYGAQLASEAH
jgi:hypothetical protein